MLTPKAIKLARGLRNNNPGNIRLSNDAWQGLAAEQTDSAFFQFVSPVYGIRAMAKIIDSYKRRGVVSVDQIISTWAPPSENNTQSYINSVYSQTGWPQGFIPVKEEGDYIALIEAIIKHENGLNPYDRDTVAEGIALS